MSITAKLHMILVLLIIAVAVYMFLLYKELRIFEHDINVLKTQVSSLVLSADVKNAACAAASSTDDQVENEDIVTIPVPVQVPVVDIEAETNDGDVDDDDDDTVAYDEINDIITNIQDDDSEDEEAVDVDIVSASVDKIPSQEETASVENTVIDDDEVKQSIIRGQMETVERDLSLLDDDTLSTLKCDELRSFLKTKLGVSVLKGTKQEFITKIKSLRAE